MGTKVRENEEKSPDLDKRSRKTTDADETDSAGFKTTTIRTVVGYWEKEIDLIGF